jgi:predicted nucleic acid-binding protein
MHLEDIRQYAAVVLRRLLAVNSSMPLYQAALDIVERYRFGWYDSLIVAAALQAGCGILYSEDMQHRQRIETMQVLNPFL